MPVEIEWHSALPILKVTYNGKLSANDYDAVNRRRSEMLDTLEGDALLLVDLQHLTGFPDAAEVERSGSALNDNRIRHILAVLPDDLYRRVARAAIHHSALRVLIYPSTADALESAESLLNS